MLDNLEINSLNVNIDAKVAEIHREYRFYEKNGEKHPLYNTTWKIFWERRYAELKKEGKHDPDSYDYKNEWIKYWMNYIKEYYFNKINFYKKNDTNSSNLSTLSICSSDDSNIINNLKRKRIKNYRKDLSTNSDSGSEDSYVSKTPKKSVCSVDSNALLYSHATSSNEAVTLISVCRTLTVLDVELGNLLSNKIFDLIAKSIELEKIQANSSDEFLLTNDNIIFLETVKEKLKGLVFTKLLDPKKLAVAKKCIQNIAQLVHQNRSSTSINEMENYNIVKDSELIEVIAKALVSFGKNDTLPEELEVIKEIYLEELEKNIEMARKDNDECHSTTNLPKLNSSFYKDISDDELHTLIKNFQKLNEIEQTEFISFITEMEETDPERVANLQDYIINVQKPIDTIEINDDDDEDYNFDELIATIK